MRSRNSTIMIGRVRLKSKRAAFSISSARDGGAKEREVAARREKDLRAEEGERERMCWSLGSLGILGREIWGVGLGKGREEVGEMRGFEEAMIMLAMVVRSLLECHVLQLVRLCLKRCTKRACIEVQRTMRCGLGFVQGAMMLLNQ